MVRSKQQIVDDFNRNVPIGTPVRYWKGPVQGVGLESTTASQAAFLSGHTPVIWLTGVVGCIALDHVEPIECVACSEYPCDCEPCPNCGETEHCGISNCQGCGEPLCECCSSNNMHHACEAAATGALYIGPRGVLEP